MAFKFIALQLLGLLAFAGAVSSQGIIPGNALIANYSAGLSLFFNDTIPLPTDTTAKPLPNLPGTPADTLIHNVEDALDTIATPVVPAPNRGTATILGTPVEYSATDSIFFDARNRRVYLFGNAKLTYGAMNLAAGRVEIDFNRNELYATGIPDSVGNLVQFPVFTEDPHTFQSREMWYNFETRRGRTVDVMTEEAEGFLHGGIVKMQPNRVIHVEEGKYTTCDHPDPHFYIGFRRAKLIPDDKIITSMAHLVIAGVPTPLVLPFGFFPNRRGQASGILMPSYGETNNRGFYLENGGFYWGINDYLDLSLTGDIYTRGSWGLRLGSNYRVRYRFSGSLNLAYAINILGEPGLPGYERSRDFRIVWNHTQDPKARPNSVFRASVNAGSSQASRFNPVSDIDYLSNTFSSNIGYTANWAGMFNFSANMRHSQNTINRMVDIGFPEISLSVNRFNPFRREGGGGETRWFEDITINYSLNARNEIRTADSLLFRPETLRKFRSGVRHNIPISHSFRLFRHINVSNNLNYNMNWYFSTIRKRWDQYAAKEVIDTVPGFRAIHDFNYSASLSTRLFGLVQFRRGPVTAIRHVFTPSVGFSFRPDFSHPFWGYYESYFNPVANREVQYAIFEQGMFGGPSPNRSGSLNFSLTNNLEMKARNRRDTADGGERKINLLDNFTISGGYDFARDSLQFSDIMVAGRTRLFGNFDITYSSSWTLYETDNQGRRINRFLWETRGWPIRLNNTSWAFSLDYTFNSRKQAAEGTQPANGSLMNGNRAAGNLMEETDLMPPTQRETIPPGVVDFSVPWQLQVGYTFNYSSRFNFRENRFDRTLIQSLNVTGTVSLTPKWRIGFRTGYDFERNELTFTSIDIYRDLHCWEMTLNWIPFGFRQSYNLTIRVKSSVLQDLKITRRTHHLDRAFQTF
ncbi:MAG TPA: putative LPS assembly protein LptD [Bacteroidales bacterium]|nr:putative LPS assembly protein LptD [Bacteroidales bacterium]